MADTIINDNDGIFKTEGSISLDDARIFMNNRIGVNIEQSNNSLKNLFDVAAANSITLPNSNGAQPYSMSELYGMSYQNNTAPVITLLGPNYLFGEINGVLSLPEAYISHVANCSPNRNFESEGWKYDDEHYVATYIHMSSLVDYSGGWPVSIAIAWMIRSFFNSDDPSASTASYSSSDWKDAQGNPILNAMDANFNNLFNNFYNVGYIARKVHLFELWDNGANYYQAAMSALYSDIYNDNRPNFSGDYEARSYTDTTNAGYTFGKFCTGPSTWSVSGYYDPFQPSAIAYKESKGNGVFGATDGHVTVFNNINAVNGLGYYIHPIRKIT